MNFKHFYLLQEKTLYHGTVTEYKDDIQKYGLIPQVGQWVKNAYGTEIDFEDDGEFVNNPNFDNAEEYYGVVFAGDKSGLDKALGGIKFHVGKKLNKYLTDVTVNDIKNHGILVVINDDDEYPDFVKHPPRNKYDRDYEIEHNPPPTVEPEDYWTRKLVKAKYILEGEALIRYLNKFGLIRTDMDGPENIKAKKTFLIKLIKQHHADMNIKDILNKVDSFDEKELDKWIPIYQDYTGEFNLTN